MSTKLYAKRNNLNFPFVTFHLQRLLYLLFFGDTHTINKIPFGSCQVTFHSSVTFKSYAKLFIFIVPQYMNITTKFSTLKLLFFSFSSCLTIEQSIVFKTKDRQCESFSRIISSATGLDKSFIFIRNTRTSSSN